MSQHTPSNQGSTHHVLIIMGTFNGADFLEAQLQSLREQTLADWSLLVSDDGSCDATASIVQAFAQGFEPGRVRVVEGPRRGFARNFLNALISAPDAQYYAFCDQDDIWQPDKLQRSIGHLEGTPDTPSLYCGRTIYFEEGSSETNLSPAFSRKPAFANALIQSLAGGNTMVMNQRAKELAATATWDGEIISHDWWLYLLVTGASGHVHFDQKPAVLYRQHANNLVGSNLGHRARVQRMFRAFRGQLVRWNDVNTAALLHAADHLSPTASQMLRDFVQARRAGLLGRVKYLLRSPLYRQTFAGNMSFNILFALKRA